MKNYTSLLLFLSYIFLTFSLGNIQAQEQGKLFITHYLAKDYQGHPQNLEVILDEEGRVYVGNSSKGILVYDGKSWQEILGFKNSVRTFCKTSDQRIYVGGDQNLGYLDKDENQQLQFHSLLSHIDKAHQAVGMVWHIHANDKAVFFLTNETLYIWSEGKMDYLALNNNYYRQFMVNNTLYLNNRRDRGIYKLVDKEIVKVEFDHPPFKKVLAELLPYDDEHILVVSRYEGLFLLNPEQNTLRPLVCEASERLKNDRINCALYLSSDQIILGSAHSGALIISKTGKILRLLDKAAGMLDLSIWRITKDSKGNLWMATNNGITKIELNTGIEFWNETNGLDGTPLVIHRVGGQLYLGTTIGMLMLKNDRFSKIESIQGFANSMTSLTGLPQKEHTLIVATDQGTFEVKEGEMKARISGPSHLIHQSLKDPKQLIGSNYSGGIFKVVYDGNNWNQEATFNDLETIGAWASSITEDSKGNIWLGTEVSGIFRVTQVETSDSTRFFQYTEEQGLPKETAFSVTTIDGQLLVYSQKGFYRWEESADRFMVDTLISSKLRLHHLQPNVYPLHANPAGDIWLYSNSIKNNRLTGGLKQADGSFVIDTSHLKRLQSDAVVSLYSESDKEIWIGTPDHIYRYRRDEVTPSDPSFNAGINKINIGGDSTLFDGHIFKGFDQDQIPEFAYHNNFIRFTFNATSLVVEEKNEFSYRLVGYEETWSPWSLDDYKEFTNLKEGDYIFELKAKNIYDIESSICQYRFSIIPPWYRTVWAYLFYFLFSLLILYLLVRRYNYRLQKENEKLENLVLARTKEVEQQRQSLEQSNAQLKTTIEQLTQTQGQLIQAEKMASLGQLTAGVAHEINNPINFISSSAEALQLDFQDIQMLLQKLLSLSEEELTIDQIREVLELKKETDFDFVVKEMDELITGIQEGATRTQNIVKGLSIFSRNTSESFHLADIEEGLDSTLLIINHQISDTIQINKEYSGIPRVNCQISKLNQVFLNLIVNAIHAIESRNAPQAEQGKIRVHTREEETAVVIQITDNGIGMSEAVQQRIFDPFFTTKKVGKGTGLGLSLSYGIIQEHQGEIIVDSQVGRGTTFTIRLPIRPEGRDDG